MSSLVAVGLCDQFGQLGIDMRRSGVVGSRCDTRDACTPVPLADYAVLIRGLLASTRAPSLGLMAACSPLNGVLRLLSHFAGALPPLRDAIAWLESNISSLVTGIRIELDDQQGCACLRLSTAEELDAEVVRFVSDYFVAVCVRAAQRAYGLDVVPNDVRFRHAAPSYVREYAFVLGREPTFGHRDCEIIFDAGLLDRRAPVPDAIVAEALHVSCENLLVQAMPGSPFAERVRALIHWQLKTRRLSSAEIAKELAVGPRRLRRLLVREGTSFKVLVDEVRCTLAKQDLARNDRCTKEIADDLGYSEASVFFRSFKRWTGMTPREYRRRTFSEGASSAAR